MWFVRHGETDWNVQGLIQGWTDTPLNSIGHMQARAVGAALAMLPEPVSTFDFVVSPLQRARQTMAHIAAALRVDHERIGVAPDVRELGFGVWEGQHFLALRSSPGYPVDPDDRFHWRPDGGESYADGQARIDAWLATLERPTVVVSHGAIGRCILAALARLPRSEAVELVMRQGCYCRLEAGEARWFDAIADAA